MGIYLTDQTMDFLWSLPLGAALGFFYDVFRILRIALPHKKEIITLEDIFFWIISAITTFFFLLGSVDGKVRFFLLIGMLLGATLYFHTVSIAVMGLSKVIIRMIYSILRFFFRFFLRPIWKILYFIVSLILRPVKFISQKLKKLLQTLKISLKKRRILLYNHLKGFKRKKKPVHNPEDITHVG